MYAPHFEIHDGVLTKCRMSGEEGNVTVTIPDGVTSVGCDAFRWCVLLESIIIPERGALFLCESLKSITIPESVTSIGDSAFDDCDILTICTPSGSYAIVYAKDNGIKCKDI